ncbi:MAG: hypothetical protein JKX70_10160, partial [Phycisphaerales bacterium]|nr:hypothetical protein [Phycisphaerales bacterium]
MPGCKVINYYFPSSEIELATESFDQGDAPEPINSVSTRGLEVRLWVVDDTHWAAPRKLLGYLHPQGDDEFNNESSVSSLGANTLTQAINPQWAQWGFRFVAVPIGEVDEFLGALRPVQPINVQWLGEFGQWRALVRAGALKNNRVRVGERTVEIAPGRPRLIARSWIEPMLTNDNVIPAVRLDLGMQIESEKNTRTQDLFGVYNERMIEDYGPVIDELLFSALLDGSHALVIVGDAPESRWEMLTDPSQGSPNDGSDGQNNSGAFGPGQEPELGTHQLQGNAD